MKVCYVLSTSEKSGGANRSFLDMLSELDRDIVEPYVLLRRNGEIEDELNRLNVPYEVIPFINAVKTGNVMKDFLKKAHMDRDVKNVKAFLRKHTFDLIHNNSMPALAGMEAAMELNIPYICHMRENVSALAPYLDRDRHMIVAKNASAIIAISSYIADCYDDLEEKNIIILPDGINTKPYENMQHPIFKNQNTIISLYGNMIPLKRQMDAVKAVEILHNKGLRNIRLNLIGDHHLEYGRKVCSYANENCGSYIKVNDAVSDQKKLLAMRRRDDIELMCSEAEGLGRVTIESIMSGCLTIGADAGATPEIIRNGVNGYLYRCGDSEALAERIEYVLKHREEASRIASAGRNAAMKKYDLKRYVRKLESIYSEILEKN